MPTKRDKSREYERTVAEGDQKPATLLRDLARLKGVSRSQIVSDVVRGATSPLGMGSNSQPRRRSK
jgi:hypothetical protein